MRKPIVFISHSSKDNNLVRKLKEILNQKLGSSLEIFVSSDGQSVPFGHNWVHEIEEALKKSAIMFVLLSPNSIGSSWIYFEAGFSYSKGIEVIPLGISGIDLSKVPPPIGLLQGFNINSPESLNNLISVINKKFEHAHRATFSKEEYADIFGVVKNKSNRMLREYAPLIYEITAQVQYVFDNPLQMIEEYLKLKKIGYQHSKDVIDTYGISIEKAEKMPLIFKLDPDLTDITIPLLNDIVKLIMEDQFKYFSLSVDFVPQISCVEGRYKVTSRFYKTEIKILDSNYFGYSKLAFNIGRRYKFKGWAPSVSGAYFHVSGGPEYEIGSVYMDLLYYGKNLTKMPLHSLLSRLFELGIFF